MQPTPIALGIDVGKDGLHLAYPIEGTEPSKWPVIALTYKDNPHWWKELLQLTSATPTIAAEPTGWHYLAPIANLIQQYTRCPLWLVNHSVTRAVREYRVNNQKTDEMDARALAHVAQDIASGQRPRGVFLHNQALENHVLNLRLLVNTIDKMKADSVRHQNRFRQFAHSLWPELGRTETYLKFVDLGVVTPQQITEITRADIPPHINGQKWHYMERLQHKIPMIGVPSAIADSLALTRHRWREIEEEIPVVQAAIHAAILTQPFMEASTRWLTIPGATVDRVAALHVATHGRILEFDVDTFRASVGAFPQKKHSGQDKKEKSSKRGYRPAMSAIHLWTQQLCNAAMSPNPIYDHFAGGEKAGGRKFTAAKGKLIKILHAVARDPDGYQYRSADLRDVSDKR